MTYECQAKMRAWREPTRENGISTSSRTEWRIEVFLFVSRCLNVRGVLRLVDTGSNQRELEVIAVGLLNWTTIVE